MRHSLTARVHVSRDISRALSRPRRRFQRRAQHSHQGASRRLGRAPRRGSRCSPPEVLARACVPRPARRPHCDVARCVRLASRRPSPSPLAGTIGSTYYTRVLPAACAGRAITASFCMSRYDRLGRMHTRCRRPARASCSRPLPKRPTTSTSSHGVHGGCASSRFTRCWRNRRTATRRSAAHPIARGCLIW